MYDADLSSYFDTISHEKMMEQLAPHCYRSVLRLIRMWLTCTVNEKDEHVEKRTLRQAKRLAGLTDMFFGFPSLTPLAFCGKH